jgi:hypothetical protein
VSNITSYVWNIKDNHECTNDPPKLFLITKSESVGVVLPQKKLSRAMNGWQNGKSKKMEV